MSRLPARLRKSHKLEHRPRFDCIALLLQGGGALGTCVAGTSIGGINSAIITGNTREKRVAKLCEF
jgi:NTE family protein